MGKLTEYSKMSKKQKKAIDAQKRGDWNGVKPYTRIEERKTDYQRYPKHKNKLDDFER